MRNTNTVVQFEKAVYGCQEREDCERRGGVHSGSRDLVVSKMSGEQADVIKQVYGASPPEYHVTPTRVQGGIPGTGVDVLGEVPTSHTRFQQIILFGKLFRHGFPQDYDDDDQNATHFEESPQQRAVKPPRYRGDADAQSEARQRGSGKDYASVVEEASGYAFDDGTGNPFTNKQIEFLRKKRRVVPQRIRGASVDRSREYSYPARSSVELPVGARSSRGDAGFGRNADPLTRARRRKLHQSYEEKLAEYADAGQMEAGGMRPGTEKLCCEIAVARVLKLHRLVKQISCKLHL